MAKPHFCLTPRLRSKFVTFAPNHEKRTAPVSTSSLFQTFYFAILVSQGHLTQSYQSSTVPRLFSTDSILLVLQDTLQQRCKRSRVWCDLCRTFLEIDQHCLLEHDRGQLGPLDVGPCRPPARCTVPLRDVTVLEAERTRNSNLHGCFLRKSPQIN